MNLLPMLASAASEAARAAAEQAEPPIADQTIATVLLVAALLFVGYRLYRHHRGSAA